jgi:formylglycine-generating enzyme required for sulfatase activity
MAGLSRDNVLKHVTTGAAAFFLAFFGVIDGQDKIDRLKDGLVRIEVRTGPNSPRIMGTGFVIAVNSSAVTILTARHLFYKEDGDALSKPEPWVTFYVDRQHSPRKAILLSTDSRTYEFAVLEVSGNDLSGLNTAQLARFELRSTSLGPREHVLVVGSDGDGWLAPEMIVASLAYQNRPDQFMYSGTGIGGGFSGSPVVDLNGLLVGIHEGEANGVTRYGRAQRMKEVAEALHVLGVRAEFDGTPAVVLAPPGRPAGTRRGPPETPAPGTVWRNEKDGLDYVWVPPAPQGYMMGCSAGDMLCYANEGPRHLILIPDGFWIGQTEVTQAAFKRMMGVVNPSDFSGDSLPEDSVSWDEAKSYCEKSGGRLPREGEWEYAARAGAAGARYGNIDDIAWYESNSGAMPHQVRGKAPNAWGLYDTLGNVWEWTLADWGAYAGGTSEVCEGCKVMRGGSWDNDASYLRASYRAAQVPADRSTLVGFRCVGGFR